MLLSYAAALLSKENTLILPVLLLSYHYIFKRSFKKTGFLLIIATAFLYALSRFTLLRGIMPDISAYHTTVIQRLPGFFVALADYMRLLILPTGLHMEYGNRLYSFADPKALAGVVILCALMFLMWRRRSDKLTLFSVTWFIVALLPQSNIYPVNAYMAEHWLYIPSIGFFIIIARWLNSLYRDNRFKVPAVLLLTCLVAAYSFINIRQNRYWKDPVTFFERTLNYSPDSSRVYSNLGGIYGNMGRYDEAIRLIKRALEINPRFEEAYANLANIYNKLGRGEEALELYKKAMEINPEIGEIYGYGSLATMYSSMGRKEEALGFYRKAIEADPDDTRLHSNLGKLYADLGRYAEAVEHCRKAIALDPDNDEAYNNLGFAYSGTGRDSEAVSAFKKAIGINPKNAKAHSNMAVLYYRAGKYDLAIKHCDAAVGLGYKVQPKLIEVLEGYRK
jgi:tetratricopeptide (TPR) repeat protein